METGVLAESSTSLRVCTHRWSGATAPANIYTYISPQWTFTQISGRGERDEGIGAGGAGAITECLQMKWFPSRCAAEFG